MATKTLNPLAEQVGGGCPWECEDPCLAEMFEVATTYYSAKLVDGFDGPPQCLRARKRGEDLMRVWRPQLVFDLDVLVL